MLKMNGLRNGGFYKLLTQNSQIDRDESLPKRVIL